jgi:hypothetical protein
MDNQRNNHASNSATNRVKVSCAGLSLEARVIFSKLALFFVQYFFFVLCKIEDLLDG